MRNYESSKAATANDAAARTATEANGPVGPLEWLDPERALRRLGAVAPKITRK